MVPPPHLVEDRILIGLKSIVTHTSVEILQFVVVLRRSVAKGTLKLME